MNSFEFAVVSADTFYRVYRDAHKRMQELWPELEHWAKTKDSLETASIASKNAVAIADWNRGEQLELEHQRARKAWENKSRFFRGPAPTRSKELLTLISSGRYHQSGIGNPLHEFRYFERPRRFEYFLELSSELGDALRLASSGPTEFHLKQGQLARMYDWKHGEPFREIEEMMNKDPIDGDKFEETA